MLTDFAQVSGVPVATTTIETSNFGRTVALIVARMARTVIDLCSNKTRMKTRSQIFIKGKM